MIRGEGPLTETCYDECVYTDDYVEDFIWASGGDCGSCSNFDESPHK